MPGPKTQKLLDKLVVPQHKGEEEVWQNSRWVSLGSGQSNDLPSCQGARSDAVL